ncbi:MAG TPA: hypothetical protein PLU15_04785 [Bacillota bacterium]|nr:hypothetical protein [Bacillota bacterium]HOO30269.1 hypothetical protein [Bacillota bacterium]HQD79998.1 hypothetical protein [Bacillota bacterium]
MLPAKKLRTSLCAIAFLCIMAVSLAAPHGADAVWAAETVRSLLELPSADRALGNNDGATLDCLVIQESGLAVATHVVEVDLVAGMNKVRVAGVSDTIQCGAAEIISGTVPFTVVSAATNRAAGELIFSVKAETASHAVFRVAYPLSGLTWSASYNAVLEPTKDAAGIWGWYSIHNETDCDLAPARIVLMGGSTNPLGSKPGFKGDSALGKTVATIDSPEMIPAGSQRNIRFAGGAAVPARLVYVVDWGPMAILDSSSQGKGERPVMLGLEFSASKETGLAYPLPGGRISVFSLSSDGTTFFLGEDLVSPCQSGTTLIAKVGPAVLLTAERTRTDQRKVGTSSWEEAYQVRIANAGTASVTVINVEEFPGQWTILQSNIPTPPIVSGRAQFSVNVPAGGQANILFRVRYTL